MVRTILETYGLGGLSIQQILGFPREPKREIIDVEYEDITDQVDPDSTPQREPLYLLENKKQPDYVDSDN